MNYRVATFTVAILFLATGGCGSEDLQEDLQASTVSTETSVPVTETPTTAGNIEQGNSMAEEPQQAESETMKDVTSQQEQETAVSDSVERRNSWVAMATQLWKQPHDGKLAFSPLSLNLALQHTKLLTTGNAEGQLNEFLAGAYLPKTEAVSNLLSQVNRIYLAQDLKLNSDFSLPESTALLDFGTSEAAKQINAWVEENTNGKIKDLVSEDLSQVRLLVANALHFQGSWATEFNPENTGAQPFIDEKGDSSDVPMMQLSDHEANYFADQKVEALLLPFAPTEDESSPAFHFLVLKGKERLMVSDLLAWLEEDSHLSKLTSLSSYQSKTLDISLPKHQIRSQFELIAPLQALGVEDIFQPSAGSFSALTSEQLAVSQVLQKTFLDISEKGVEAAAATAVLATRSMKEAFQVDGPFIAMVVAQPKDAESDLQPVMLELVGKL